MPDSVVEEFKYRPRAFRFSPLVGFDGEILMVGNREATEGDMYRWMCRHDVEPEWDRLTLEYCTYERSKGRRLDKEWLDFERASFNRIRAREKRAA